MKYFKKMLIPTDGCDFAKAGVLQGMRISKVLGCQPIVVIPVDEAIFMKDDCEVETFEAAENIGEEVGDAASSIDLGLQIISKEGDAKDVIKEILSKDEDINLICIGTRGYKDTKDMLMGTLHENLLKVGRLPIIIQPYRSKRYLKKFNAIREKKVYAGKHRIIILLAMDGSEQANMAAFEAVQFANQLNVAAQVYALHVVESQKDSDGKEKIVPGDHMGIPNLAKEIGLSVGVIVTPEVRVGEDKGMQILKRAAELKADLIVMGSHGKTGPLSRSIGNKTQFILESVPVPVMLVPPELRRTLKDVETDEFVDDAWDEIKH